MKKLLILSLLTIGLILNPTPAQSQSLTNKVVVAWDAVTQYVGGSTIESTNVVKYNIYRAENAALTTNLIKLNGTNVVTALTFQDPAPQYNKVYFYTVTAYVIDGVESEYAAPVSLNTRRPLPPVVRMTISP